MHSVLNGVIFIALCTRTDINNFCMLFSVHIVTELAELALYISSSLGSRIKTRILVHPKLPLECELTKLTSTMTASGKLFYIFTMHAQKECLCLLHTNNNNNRFMALCPGLPGWAGTRRNKLLAATLRGLRPGVQSPSIIMTSLMMS